MRATRDVLRALVAAGGCRIDGLPGWHASSSEGCWTPLSVLPLLGNCGHRIARPSCFGPYRTRTARTSSCTSPPTTARRAPPGAACSSEHEFFYLWLRWMASHHGLLFAAACWAHTCSCECWGRSHASLKLPTSMVRPVLLGVQASGCCSPAAGGRRCGQACRRRASQWRPCCRATPVRCCVAVMRLLCGGAEA